MKEGFRTYSRFFAVFAILVLFFSMSGAAHAAEPWKGLVPSCGVTPDPVKGAGGETTRTYTPCSTCDLAVLVKNALDFVVKDIALAGVALMLMIGGFQMVTGAIGGSATAHQKGRATIKNAFIGLAIVLFAWLAVDTIIKFIAQQSLTSGSPAKLFENEPGAGEPVQNLDFSISSNEIGYGFWNKIKCATLDSVKVTTKPPPPPSKTPPGAPAPPGPAPSATQQTIPAEYKSAAEEAQRSASFVPSGSCTSNGKAVSPQLNIAEAAAGRQITYCSRGCQNTPNQGCGGVGGGGFITPNLAMLRGMSGIYNMCGGYTVISLAGGGEHVANSQHYEGRAMDIRLNRPRGSAWTDCLNNIRGVLSGVDSSPTTGTFCDSGGKPVDCGSASHIHVEFRP